MNHFIKTRREILSTASKLGLASTAFSFLNSEGKAASKGASAKAKRVIYLCQSGAPSQIDLFDHKPALQHYYGTDLPESIRKGQRLTTMTAGQDSFPLAPSVFEFSKWGESGADVSSLMPNIGRISDDLCFIKSLHTDAINHDPAITFLQTGFEQAGRPSFGSWVDYALGSDSSDLPAFVVMLSRGSGRPNCQPLYNRLWGSGFLPSKHQGVKFSSHGDPILFLRNPEGVVDDVRRENLDAIAELNKLDYQQSGDGEILSRIAQYEMAAKMQSSIPDVADLSDEPESTFELYGEDARTPGTYAYNCVMARRLAEKDVRFVQLFHMGWDQHNALPKQIAGQCRDTDQASAALVSDLKQRGMLDDTIVIWGGEFGRTAYSQGELTPDNYGRDHHPKCFTMWLAGGGFKPGLTYGKTDDFSYNVDENPVHIHDLNATLLHQLGLDHEKVTFRHQGREHRLTDVHGHVVKDILS